MWRNVSVLSSDIQVSPMFCLTGNAALRDIADPALLCGARKVRSVLRSDSLLNLTAGFTRDILVRRTESATAGKPS